MIRLQTPRLPLAFVEVCRCLRSLISSKLLIGKPYYCARSLSAPSPSGVQSPLVLLPFVFSYLALVFGSRFFCCRTGLAFRFSLFSEHGFDQVVKRSILGTVLQARVKRCTHVCKRVVARGSVCVPHNHCARR